jgi:hypothetical protein
MRCPVHWRTPAARVGVRISSPAQSMAGVLSSAATTAHVPGARWQRRSCGESPGAGSALRKATRSVLSWLTTWYLGGREARIPWTTSSPYAVDTTHESERRKLDAGEVTGGARVRKVTAQAPPRAVSFSQTCAKLASGGSG